MFFFFQTSYFFSFAMQLGNLAKILRNTSSKRYKKTNIFFLFQTQTKMNYQEKQSLLPTTMADEQPCERYDCQKKLKKAKRRSFKVAAYAFLVCLIFYMLRRDEHPHWNNHIAHTNKVTKWLCRLKE